MNRNLYLSAALLSLLAACSDANQGSGSAAGNPSSTQTQDAPIIENEDLTPGLKGIDADGNGIRDDIDRLIAKKYAATPAMKKAAELTARALQKAMEATTNDEARAAGNEIMRAGSCAYKAFPHATPSEITLREQMSTEIEALTANTRERFKAYWNGERLAGGMVFKLPSNPVCD
jgi:hypothetical protein